MKYLEKTFKDIPAHIPNHLNKRVSQVIALVVDRTIPITLTMALKDTISPTLKTVLDNTIIDSIALLMEGSFTGFMTQFFFIGMDMAWAVHHSVASAKVPLLEHYSAVQEDYSACKAWLEEVFTLLSAKAKEDKQIIQILNNLHGLPSSAPALPSCTTPVDHGGDADQII
jgi:hypothetical protein